MAKGVRAGEESLEERLTRALRRGPRTAIALAAACDCKVSGAVTALRRMKAHGLVQEAGTQAATGGKQAKVWKLAGDGNGRG